jgi:AcrR family transcriptional regulator
MAPTLMERRRQSALEEIVDVALDLFLRNGFEATTVESIAAKAGCSPRTFYRYFGSKEDVMFHDLLDAIAGMGRVLDAHLADGLPEWPAVSASLIEFIARFDAGHVLTATRRMDLWSHEPALRARYLQYIALAEDTVLASLCRHRGTLPEHDDTAQLIAVASVGAYRITVATHGSADRGRGDRRLAEHLRDSLAVLATGLDPGTSAGTAPDTATRPDTTPAGR